MDVDWRADLDRLACAVCRSATAHDAGPDVPSLYGGFDRAGRSQERSTNGSAASG